MDTLPQQPERRNWGILLRHFWGKFERHWQQASRAAFADRVRELIGADNIVMALVEPLLAIVAATMLRVRVLTKQVLDMARKEQVCRRLMSAPRVGPITALHIAACATSITSM
ncbi:hypothetical protein NKH91_31875 [Mesorhizobium sp. M0894]|uniref:hypothetical protein n=1 Tax=unclassified Mesorhizobium TaxID=325217 RepID=UPI0033368733